VSYVFDVVEADFESRVIERSREVPVIVDFWAEWCGPCRQLGPALEAAVDERGGRVELAKVDVDSNQMLAQAFGIQGIPAVKAIRDGRVASEFTGAIPPAQVAKFIDALLPSEADELAAAGDEDSLRAALASDPRHPGAALSLARLLIGRGEDAEARELLAAIGDTDFLAAGLLARLDLQEASAGGATNGASPNTLAEAFDAWDAGDAASALEALQGEIVRVSDPERRDLLRRVMVAIFTELGPGDPLASEHRRRLAAALN
jgi:putative thioredoxin